MKPNAAPGISSQTRRGPHHKNVSEAELNFTKKYRVIDKRRKISDLKYRKYFLNELPQGIRTKGHRKMSGIFTDNDIIPGTQYFAAGFMGPEMEKHVITESTLVFIPANFIHCPFRVTRMDRPFILIQSQYAPKHTETSLRHLIDKDKLDRTIMIDEDGT